MKLVKINTCHNSNTKHDLVTVIKNLLFNGKHTSSLDSSPEVQTVLSACHWLPDPFHLARSPFSSTHPIFSFLFVKHLPSSFFLPNFS